jgi:plastocyanin
MRRLLPLLTAIGFAACGSSSSPTSPPPANPFTFTITAAGISPKEFTVPPGSRVLFVNNDTKRRNMTSDPHPEHDACPEINSVGLLNAGANRETANLNTVRTCGFHDHDDPSNAAVLGRIIIRP